MSAARRKQRRWKKITQRHNTISKRLTQALIDKSVKPEIVFHPNDLKNILKDGGNPLGDAYKYCPLCYKKKEKEFNNLCNSCWAEYQNLFNQ